MDRVDNYRDLLPQYLRGENIERHCNVIERMINKLYSQIHILQDWNVLDRPILVEWSKELNTISAGITNIKQTTVTYNIHINTHNPIRKIRITGGYEYEEEHPSRMVVTNTTISFTKRYDTHFRVEVETHNDIHYVKEYPENDTIQGNDADHDKYLDIVGSFLGVPRKQYIEYPVSEGSKANPPYFGKTKYYRNWVQYYGSCTEDDFVYANRLKEFLEDKKDSVLAAFIKARYAKRILLVTGDDILLTDLSYNFPDFVEEHNITQEWIDANKYGLYTVYVSTDDVPSNYTHVFNNDEIYLDINRFLPCTRLALIADMKSVELQYNVIDISTGWGNNANTNKATIKFKFNRPYLDFTYTVDSNSYDGRTDANGEYVFDVKSSDRTDTFSFTVSTTGQHGETPFSDSFEIPVVWYQIDKYKYASHDEYDYTYSSELRPTSTPILDGYSNITEEKYYEGG